MRGRPWRSLAQESVSCEMTLSSRTPCPASMRASASTESSVRLWNRPRIAGIAQNAHTRSQPSAIFK